MVAVKSTSQVAKQTTRTQIAMQIVLVVDSVRRVRGMQWRGDVHVALLPPVAEKRAACDRFVCLEAECLRPHAPAHNCVDVVKGQGLDHGVTLFGVHPNRYVADVLEYSAGLA